MSRVLSCDDELLFKQPESTHLGDCPICSLPIPIAASQDKVRYTTYPCCSKVVCDGCVYANCLRENEANLQPSCPFCRQPTPTTGEGFLLNLKKRIGANDPVALDIEGARHTLAGDHLTAIDYYEKAAGLGSIQSHYNLAGTYHKVAGAEMDIKIYTYHMEQAAIGGHALARYNLGLIERRKGNKQRAVKHWIIAANLGLDKSIKTLKDYYAQGVVSKGDFAAALRAHHVAVDATKSPQRDAAQVAQKMGRWNVDAPSI
jgi:tetratricopeptide (TPR) repeat protein